MEVLFVRKCEEISKNVNEVNKEYKSVQSFFYFERNTVFKVSFI